MISEAVSEKSEAAFFVRKGGSLQLSVTTRFFTDFRVHRRLELWAATMAADLQLWWSREVARVRTWSLEQPPLD